MAKACPYSNSRNSCSGGGLNARARIFEREGQIGRSIHRAQPFQIWHWMRLAVRKLIADDDGLEPVNDSESGKHHSAFTRGAFVTATMGMAARSASASSVINPANGWICPEASLRNAASFSAMMAA